MRDVEDRIVCGVGAAVGAIPVVATLITAGRFGVAPTIGLGALVLGIAGMLRRPRRRLPRARLRRRS